MIEFESVVDKLLRAKELILESDNIVEKDKRKNILKNAAELYLEVLNKVGKSAEISALIAECNLELESTISDDKEKSYYFDQAVEWAKKATEIAPDNAGLHAFLGMLHEIAHVDYNASADEYRKAIALSPYDADLYVDAAFTHDHHSPDTPVTLEEETEWLEHAVHLKPDSPNYQAFLGRLYFEAGRTEEAKKAAIIALISHRPIQHGYLENIKTIFGIK